MTLQEYVDNLNKFLKEHPEAKEFPIFAFTDRGQSVEEVTCTPTLADWDGLADDWLDEDGIQDYNEDESPEDAVKINSVCIN